ncbi:MAG: hypothetical protein EBQ89_01190 [Alphaproteobacteria bacterium]|nr:hypothetical protein [Alphaproteobacteria bacterium]
MIDAAERLLLLYIGLIAPTTSYTPPSVANFESAQSSVSVKVRLQMIEKGSKAYGSDRRNGNRLTLVGQSMKNQC